MSCNGNFSDPYPLTMKTLTHIAKAQALLWVRVMVIGSQMVICSDMYIRSTLTLILCNSVP